MSKLRSLNTAIWCDTWFEELTTSQKLLFVYCITNEKTSMLGVYEISLRKISFETGVPVKDIEKAFKLFTKDGKIKYESNRVILTNYLKHQKYNFNMKKSAIENYNELPDELKIVGVSKLAKTEEAFETLCDGFGIVRKVKVEVESKLELEDEEETKDELEDEIIYPFDSIVFKEQWEVWKGYKRDEHKFTFKSLISQQAALKGLSEMCNNSEEIAIAIIHQSIANGYKGLFELKNNQNGKQKKSVSNKDLADAYERFKGGVN